MTLILMGSEEAKLELPQLISSARWEAWTVALTALAISAAVPVSWRSMPPARRGLRQANATIGCMKPPRSLRSLLPEEAPLALRAAAQA